jgi:hypothetical protein
MLPRLAASSNKFPTSVVCTESGGSSRWGKSNRTFNCTSHWESVGAPANSQWGDRKDSLCFKFQEVGYDSCGPDCEITNIR